jgi:hypothetical protein
LDLPWQTAARVVREEFVAVHVFVYESVDDAKVGLWRQTANQVWRGPRATIVEDEVVGIRELSVIEDVEELSAELAA